MPEADPDRRAAADRDYARSMWGACAMLATAFLGAIFAIMPYDWVRSIGVVMVTLAVGGIGGAAVGFLFGIPRVLTDAGPPAAISVTPDAATDGSQTAAATPRAKRYLASNSNLEQVSDWLTKIILGVGLTQFYQLNGLLLGFEELVARHVPASDRATPMIAAIVIVFAVLCGFLAMYLETRLVLSRIFSTVERDLSETLENTQRELAKSETQRDNAEGQAQILEGALTKISEAPLTTPTMLTSAADWLKSAASSDLATDAIRSVAAQVLAASGRTKEASTLIDSGAGASVSGRISAMQVALYKAPPAGFEEVIAIAGELSNVPEARTNAEYWFYGSAAFGQQHRYVRSLPDTADTMERLQSARDNALDCLQRCIAIDPGYKTRFAWLIDPAQSPTPDDDDLADFADDPAFRAAVATVA